MADVLGMGKDRVHRICKKNAATFEKQRQRMLSQDPEYMALKKAEQETERKAKRAEALEETRSMHHATNNACVSLFDAVALFC